MLIEEDSLLDNIDALETEYIHDDSMVPLLIIGVFIVGIVIGFVIGISI